jgi:hypothetical protein
LCLPYLLWLLGFTKRLPDQVEILLVQLGFLLSFLSSLALSALSLLCRVLGLLLIVFILDNEAFADLVPKSTVQQTKRSVGAT